MYRRHFYYKFILMNDWSKVESYNHIRILYYMIHVHANKGIIGNCRTGLAKLTYSGHVFRSSAIDKFYWYRINAPHKISFYYQLGEKK